jgi:hypothetical protein
MGPFHSPPNFDKRNVALIGLIIGAIHKDKFAEFKTVSIAFRRGDSTPTTYFDACVSIFDSRMADIFPELLALLPDVDKQNAVYIIALEAQTSPYKSVDTGVVNLIECEKCGQVVTVADAGVHMELHPVVVQDDFPEMPATAKSKKKKKKGKAGGGDTADTAGTWGNGSATVQQSGGTYRPVQRAAPPPQWGGGGGGGW